MFDTPDLGPLCVAPFIAIFVGLIIYISGRIIIYIGSKKSVRIKSQWKEYILLIAVVSIPVICLRQ